MRPYDEIIIGKELTPNEARDALDDGEILSTKDGKENAKKMKRTYATWSTGGNTMNIVNFLTDFSGWYRTIEIKFPQTMFTAVFDAELEKPDYKEWLHSLMRPQFFKSQQELF